MRLLLLRHAAHDLAGRALAGRMPGLGLNALGRAQALALAGSPALRGVQAIHASPQQRTRETAEPIAQRLGLVPQSAPEFDEIDFGDWTGKAFDELAQGDAARWRHWCERRSQATPPGGEPFAEVARRACEGAHRLARQHPGQVVLVVSHADVIRAVIAGFLGLSLDELERFEIGCAGLSEIELGEGGARVLRVNCGAV